VQQRHVDHRDLVHDQEIGLEQPVQDPGLQARGLAHPLGGAARGRGQDNGRGLGPENLEDGVDQCGLAHPGPAGDHQHFRA
jgi:hypothetical protein